MSGNAKLHGRVIPAATFLAVLEDEGRKSLKAGGELLLDQIAATGPRRSSKLVDGFQARASRTSTGNAVTVRPARKPHGPQAQTVAQVARWVSRGTGIYRTGGTGIADARRIRSPNKRRMILPGGTARWTVAGQRPNPFFRLAKDRVQPAIEAEMQHGRDRAIRRLARTH